MLIIQGRPYIEERLSGDTKYFACRTEGCSIEEVLLVSTARLGNDSYDMQLAKSTG
jgi:hypothetical protein